VNVALSRRALDAPSPAIILIPAVGADGVLYPIEKMEAHRDGVLHLAVSVFAFRGRELLIQQRAAGKYHSGLQWANSVCTHPHWDETPAASAHRRLREELGLEASVQACAMIDYEADVGSGLREVERVQVFRAEIAAAAPLAPDPAEVAAIRWAAPDALMAEARAEPGRFAPWFRIYLERWNELGLD
jgi:isopentenyl-diphosphate delta-isomerase